MFAFLAAKNGSQMNATNVTLKQVSSVVTIAQRDQTPRHTDGCLTMPKGHLMMSSSVYLVDNKEKEMDGRDAPCKGINTHTFTVIDWGLAHNRLDCWLLHECQICSARYETVGA